MLSSYFIILIIALNIKIFRFENNFPEKDGKLQQRFFFPGFQVPSISPNPCPSGNITCIFNSFRCKDANDCTYYQSCCKATQNNSPVAMCCVDLPTTTTTPSVTTLNTLSTSTGPTTSLATATVPTTSVATVPTISVSTATAPTISLSTATGPTVSTATAPTVSSTATPVSTPAAG